MSHTALRYSAGSPSPPCAPLTPTPRSLSTGSKSNSTGGTNTPVRKISAHDFEKGGLTKPIVSCIDGTPTFLSPLTSSYEFTGQIRKKSRTDLQTLDETELILELVKDISNDLDVRSLCHKILQVWYGQGDPVLMVNSRMLES